MYERKYCHRQKFRKIMRTWREKQREINKATGRNATQLSEYLLQQLIPNRKKCTKWTLFLRVHLFKDGLRFIGFVLELYHCQQNLKYLLFFSSILFSWCWLRFIDLFTYFSIVSLPFIIIFHLRYRCGFDTLIKIAPYPNGIQRIVNWLNSSSAHTHNSEIWFKLHTIEHNSAPVFGNNPFWSTLKPINSWVFIQ